MRDPKRIDVFCAELAKVWKTQVPDWRFGQLLVNLPFERDPFYMEEDEMMSFIKKVLKYEDKNE